MMGEGKESRGLAPVQPQVASQGAVVLLYPGERPQHEGGGVAVGAGASLSVCRNGDGKRVDDAGRRGGLYSNLSLTRGGRELDSRPHRARGIASRGGRVVVAVGDGCVGEGE